MRKLLILFFCLAISVRATETKKYNLSVCALFKNESPYLKEWIEYHRLIGVDHFYLYNNGSLDGFKKVLNPYIRNKLVTLVQWADPLGPMMNNDEVWALSTQVPAYENAAKWKAIKETKWLVFLDVDEFLVPCSEKGLVEILEKNDESPGIILLSEYYNASTRSVLPPRKLVIEATEITAPHPPVILRAVEKTIFKPELCTSISWPPYHCRFNGGKEAVKMDQHVLRINRYENRMRFQRLEKIQRKLQVGKNLSDSEKADLLRSGYEIEDPERAIYRFVPDLYKKMGYLSP